MQGELLALSRGRFAWTLTVPEDGSLPLGGVLPSLIDWRTERPHRSLPEVGTSLLSLTLLTPQPDALLAALEACSFRPWSR